MLTCLTVAACILAHVSLPPARYDHAPTRTYRVFEVSSHQLYRSCNGHRYQSTVYACTRFGFDNGYYIVMPRRHVIGERAWQHLLRHELGHVNGWPTHHPR